MPCEGARKVSPPFIFYAMNNDNKNLNMEPTTEILSIEPPKRSWWKYVVGVLAIVIAVLGGYIGWYQYFSQEAKYRREVEKSALELPAKLEAYKKAMEADTYGGKTPEETLQLFIEALRNEDIELASKYFALDDDTAKPDAVWVEGLIKAKNEERLGNLVDILLRAKKGDSFMDGYYGFEVVNEEGIVDVFVGMKFNKYSGVWKIESL